jgi:hypothetical protein
VTLLAAQSLLLLLALRHPTGLRELVVGLHLATVAIATLPLLLSTL